MWCSFKWQWQSKKSPVLRDTNEIRWKQLLGNSIIIFTFPRLWRWWLPRCAIVDLLISSAACLAFLLAFLTSLEPEQKKNNCAFPVITLRASWGCIWITIVCLHCVTDCLQNSCLQTLFEVEKTSWKSHNDDFSLESQIRLRRGRLLKWRTHKLTKSFRHKLSTCSFSHSVGLVNAVYDIGKELNLCSDSIQFPSATAMKFLRGQHSKNSFFPSRLGTV